MNYQAPSDHSSPRCPECGSGKRCPLRQIDQYVCSVCASKAPMFNHVRPPEMQGAAQSIFAPWPTKVRAS